MNRIRNIDFLRIICCLSIIVYHLWQRSYPLFSDINIYNKLKVAQYGYLGVDVFFIISGFFFILKFDKAVSIFSILKKKVMNFYPVLIFVMLLYLVFSFTGAVKFNLYDCTMILLGLNGSPLVMRIGTVGVFWYISSMLWSICLFSYILKNYQPKNVNLFLAVAVVLSYSFLIHYNNGIIEENPAKHVVCGLNGGLLRAIGGMGIGYFIGTWYKEYANYFKNINLSLNKKILITIVEFMCLYFIINNLMFHCLKFNNQVIYIVVASLLFILFLFNKGYISRFLNNNIWTYLAKYTFSIFMTHTFVMNTIKGGIWKVHPEIVYAHPYLNIFITLLLCLLLGIFTYHFVEKLFLKIFIKKGYYE